jgi:5'(3')-deoxyribonucleotidase
MKIAVDFDSTLADTLQVVLDMFNFKYGTKLEPSHIVDWDWKKNAEFWNSVGLNGEGLLFDPEEVERDFWKVYDLFDHTHLRRAIRPVDPLACGAIKWLVLRGHDVRIVTSNKPDAEVSIRSWLFGHGLDLPLDIIGRKSASQKAALNYDLFIDDSPSLAPACEELKKPLLLVPQPYNTDVLRQGYVRRFNWRDAIDIFEDMGL